MTPIDSETMADVLLIDPSQREAAPLAEFLTRAGYRVVSVGTAAEARDEVAKWRPSCILMELALPDQDGLVLIPWLAEQARAPGIVVLTRQGGTSLSTLALKLGADDFVRKPTDPFELQARVARVIERSRLDIARPAPREEKIVVGDLEVDPGKHTVRVEGKPLQLTATEFRLLLALAQSAGKIVTRSELSEHIWGYVMDPPHVVDVHTGRLRRKLRAITDIDLIETVRGSGFRLARSLALQSVPNDQTPNAASPFP